MKFYMNNTKRNVKAILEIKDNMYVVKKGSKVSNEISNSFRSKDVVRKRREGLVNSDYLTIKDIVFNSPSIAGEFVLGTSCNGTKKWKNKEGKTLKEIIE